jgi:hypothetical protein
MPPKKATGSAKGKAKKSESEEVAPQTPKDKFDAMDEQQLVAEVCARASRRRPPRPRCRPHV